MPLAPVWRSSGIKHSLKPRSNHQLTFLHHSFFPFSLPHIFTAKELKARNTTLKPDASSFRSKTTNAPIDMHSCYVNRSKLRSEEQSVQLFKRVGQARTDATGSPNARNRKQCLFCLERALVSYPVSIIQRNRERKRVCAVLLEMLLCSTNCYVRKPLISSDPERS